MAIQPTNPAEVFESYYGPGMFQPWARRLIGAAQPVPGERILDLACATGTVARELAELDDFELHGLDFSPAMLGVARSTSAGKSISWVEGSAMELPYEDDYFDLVISQQGLQFFPGREESAREVHRVLKPGGRLVASVWQGLDKHPLFRGMFREVAERLDVPMARASLPFSMGDPAELIEYANAGGLRDASVSEDSLAIELTEPGSFVPLSVAAAAAAIPAFGEMSQEKRSAMAAEIAESLSGEVRKYLDGDRLKVPSYVNVVVAKK